jgi:hypothetical protein
MESLIWRNANSTRGSPLDNDVDFKKMEGLQRGKKFS